MKVSAVESKSSITPAQERTIVHRAILSRKVDETFLELFAKGKISGTIHTCIGQEFSGAVVCSLLEKGDAVFSNHRCHGHFLSFTQNVDGLVAEIMGRASGVCGGRGGSQHLCHEGFYSNGIQGGFTPVASGLALSRKLQRNAKISVAFIGDGTLGEGAVYESFNIASKWELPLLFVLENNGVAQSTDTADTIAGDIMLRAEAFSIRTAAADTWNWKDLYTTAAELIGYVRREGKPALLQIDTYRLKAHSKGDDIRPRSQVEAYEKRDPLNLLQQEQPQYFEEISREVETVIAAAVAKAEQSPFPQWNPDPQKPGNPLTWERHTPEKKRLGVAINECFKSLMKAESRLYFIGEDIKSPYGGAFKIAQDLSDLFPDRVLPTPISEAAIVGLGTGLSFDGFRPFVELMFGDFTALTFDQLLNHAAKFSDMYNGKVKTNVVVRTPMGGGRGYGPTHSQTLDKHFLGIPGLRVIAVNNLIAPSLIYESLVRGDPGATLLVENKRLYALDLRHQLPQGFVTQVSGGQFPSVWVKAEASAVDLTIIGYGGMSDFMVDALEGLFLKADIVAQILCPTQIYPFDIREYTEILRLAPNVLFVEEGQGFGSFTSELSAQIAENPMLRHLNVGRIAAAPACIAASGPMEKMMLPGVEQIIEGATRLVQKSVG